MSSLTDLPDSLYDATARFATSLGDRIYAGTSDLSTMIGADTISSLETLTQRGLQIVDHNPRRSAALALAATTALSGLFVGRYLTSNGNDTALTSAQGYDLSAQENVSLAADLAASQNAGIAAELDRVRRSCGAAYLKLKKATIRADEVNRNLSSLCDRADHTVSELGEATAEASAQHGKEEKLLTDLKEQMERAELVWKMLVQQNDGWANAQAHQRGPSRE